MTPTANKLPLWRWILGIGVFGGFAAIIGLLTPVYVDDFRLHEYVVSLEQAPAASDDTLLSEVVTRAHALDLPVQPANIHLVHTPGKVKIEMRYVVQMNLVVWPVDLHFPTIR